MQEINRSWSVKDLKIQGRGGLTLRSKLPTAHPIPFVISEGSNLPSPSFPKRADSPKKFADPTNFERWIDQLPIITPGLRLPRKLLFFPPFY